MKLLKTLNNVGDWEFITPLSVISIAPVSVKIDKYTMHSLKSRVYNMDEFELLVERIDKKLEEFKQQDKKQQERMDKDPDWMAIGYHRDHQYMFHSGTAIKCFGEVAHESIETPEVIQERLLKCLEGISLSEHPLHEVAKRHLEL